MDRLIDWTLASWADVAMALVSVAIVYAAIILYCRLVGVRSFAKISAFDFAMTVAVGSMFASSVATREPPLTLALVALGGLFAGQWLIGWARRRSRFAKRLVDNEPLLLMRDGRVISANLRRAQITMDDLRAKLREANVLRYSQVRAAVAETSGDISVLHTANESERLDEDLLAGVSGERAGGPKSDS